MDELAVHSVLSVAVSGAGFAGAEEFRKNGVSDPTRLWPPIWRSPLNIRSCTICCRKMVSPILRC